jgi:sorbitol-specific phosphotransferase system component IIC
LTAAYIWTPLHHDVIITLKISKKRCGIKLASDFNIRVRLFYNNFIFSFAAIVEEGIYGEFGKAADGYCTALLDLFFDVCSKPCELHVVYLVVALGLNALAKNVAFSIRYIFLFH